MGGIDLTGTTPDLVRYSATPLWTVNAPEGPALQGFDGASGNGGLMTSPPLPASSPLLGWQQQSYYYRGSRDNNTATTGHAFCYCMYTSYDGANPTFPYQVFQIGDPFGSGSLAHLACAWNDGANSQQSATTTDASSLTYGTISMLGTANVFGSVKTYQRGVLVDTTVWEPGGTHNPPANTSNAAFNLQGWDFQNRQTPTHCYIACIWNRELSANEAAAIDADPYAFLVPDEGELPATTMTAQALSFGRTSGSRKSKFAFRNKRAVPRGRLSIDWSHPLANGLHCYVLGGLAPGGSVDLVSGQIISWTTKTLPPNLGITQDGPSLKFADTASTNTGISNQNIRLAQSSKATGDGDFTFAGLVTLNVNEGTTNTRYTELFGQTDAGGTHFVDVYINNAGELSYEGDLSPIPGSIVPTAGQRLSLAIVRDSLMRAYSNGQQIGTNAVTGVDITGGGTTFLNIGGWAGFTTPVQAQFDLTWVGGWDRALSPQEILQLDQDPYCFLISDQDEAIAGPTVTGSGSASHDLTLTAGSIPITGYSNALKATRQQPLAAGAISITAHATNFQLARKTALTGASISITGHNTTFDTARKISLTAGAVPLTDESVTLKVTRELPLDTSANVPFHPRVVILTYSGAPAGTSGLEITWSFADGIHSMLS
jgi:hypothetical protein